MSGFTTSGAHCLDGSPGVYPINSLGRVVDEPKQYQSSTKAAPKQHQSSTKAVPKQYQSSTKAVPKQHQSSTKAVPKQHQSSTKAAPKQHQSSTKAVPKQYQSSTKAVPNRDHLRIRKLKHVKEFDSQQRRGFAHAPSRQRLTVRLFPFSEATLEYCI